MHILDLLFVPKCVFCQTVLVIGTDYPYLCKECREGLPEIPRRICKQCGKPLDIQPLKPYCPYCAETQKYHFDFSLSCFFYEGAVRESILRFKFGKKPYYAKTYSHFILDILPKDITFDLITCAPISQQRMKERDYNQAKVLATEIAKLSGIPFEELLTKTRETPAQSVLTFAQRRENVKDSYAVLRPICEKNLLFIDDVLTTASTASECAKLLRKNGAKKVVAATIAATKPLDYINAISDYTKETSLPVSADS